MRKILITFAMPALLLVSVPCQKVRASAFEELKESAVSVEEEEYGPQAPSPYNESAAAPDLSHIDPGHIVPQRPLSEALDYYRNSLSVIGNPDYLSVIDYTQSSVNKRFYLINMRTGAVERFLVAHGKGSDPDHTGYAEYFSNEKGSLATSLGFFLTAETYIGENGYSLRLHGLSHSNSNALARYIVIHGAWYVDPAYDPLGRSWGCPALEKAESLRVIESIKGGSIVYAYHGRFSAD